MVLQNISDLMLKNYSESEWCSWNMPKSHALYAEAENIPDANLLGIFELFPQIIIHNKPSKVPLKTPEQLAFMVVELAPDWVEELADLTVDWVDNLVEDNSVELVLVDNSAVHRLAL
jgi:hypothetical protein